MTREDVLKLFPDATDEQITNLLNQNNSEVAREKNKAGKDKEELARLKEVEKEYNEFKEQGMSENEKTVKALESANQKIAELEKRDIIRTQRANAMEKFGLTAEQASKVVTDDGATDYEVLGQIFADSKKSAIAEYEKQKLDGTPNPGGSTGGDGKDEKPEDVKNAESISFGTQSSEQSAKDYYVMK